MMLGTLKTRDYRMLWIGQSISHLGDQFHLIALPWLVLSLTHDPFQLGLVLALAGIPRAAMMLFGGAFLLLETRGVTEMSSASVAAAASRRRRNG